MDAKDVAGRLAGLKRQMATDQTVVAKTLGDAVLALCERGQPVSNEALIAQLMEPVRTAAPDDMRRQTAEAAARPLGWAP